jgi:glycerol uptake facilitator-like aquaporin
MSAPDGGHSATAMVSPDGMARHPDPAPGMGNDRPVLRRDPARQLAGEFLGTMALLVAIVGSGIATSSGDAASSTQLFQHAAVVGATLFVLIWILRTVCDAHFNPAVTLAAVLLGLLPRRLAAAYVVAQFLGAVVGTVVAHLLFLAPAVQFGTTERWGVHLGGSEFVATAGLVVVIFALVRAGEGRVVPAAVGAWIGGAVFFTSSMSFANPAVSVARMLTDSWTAIVPGHVPAFVVAQLVGAVAAAGLVAWLFAPEPEQATPDALADTTARDRPIVVASATTQEHAR